MNIFILLFLLLMAYAFVNYKKAFLLYVVMRIILNVNINLINHPGLPVLSLEFVMNLFFLIVYIIKRKRLREKEKFPFLLGFGAILFSLAISTIFSEVPFFEALARASQEFLNSYIFVYIFWCIVTTQKDIKFLVKGFFIIFLIIIFYGLFERINGFSNPIMAYELSLNEGRGFDYSYGDERLGLGRVQSLILHAIGLGLYMGLMIAFFGYIFQKYNQYLRISFPTKIIFLGLCLLILFFTNSRSPLVFMVICIVPFIRLNKLLIGKIAFAGLLLIVLWNNLEPYIENIRSIFDTDNTEVSGSSFEMRLGQLAVAVYYFSQSPLIGLGVKSMDAIMEADIGLLGAESVWFLLMIERGILGCVAYITLIGNMLYWSVKIKNINITCIIIAWLMVNTITTVPGIDFSFLCIIIILMYKMQQYNQVQIGKTNL